MAAAWCASSDTLCLSGGAPRPAVQRRGLPAYGLQPAPLHRLVRRSPIPSLLSPAKADISKLPKTGHFYFALTARRDPRCGSSLGTLISDGSAFYGTSKGP